MKPAARLLVISSVLVSGCVHVRDAAVTTFRVVDAPARYVRNRIDPPLTTTTTSTETTYAGSSDVVTPGRPVNAAPVPTERSLARNRETQPRSSASGTPRVSHADATTAARKPAAGATPRPKSSTETAQFPTAKAVPGKPGYVYSLDSNGGMVDVTGYKSGDKAKDPYTKQIFIVP
ncbi:MAG: hypothetical protein M3Z22_03580 [Verrucomicrobiota bacterium]|nr:hypothetical protein [Verrucomicrobiota bacterium]